MRLIKSFALTLTATLTAFASNAQSAPMSATADELVPDSIEICYESLADSLICEAAVSDTVMSLRPLARDFFLPFLYNSYVIPDTASVFAPDYSGNPAMRWIEDEASYAKRKQRALQAFALNHTPQLRYIASLLPEAPKEFTVMVNPDDHTITINEISTEGMSMPTITKEEVQKKYWIKNFNASLQFSQAYVSPNWYQGGNNNVNALLNIYYNVKLNQKFHPNLLFDNTFQYKLGINSAPDDTIRSYNVSSDVLQINSVFGLKAFKKWYYSVNGQFKTQLVNSYKSNTNDLRSAFMSPAELNLGVGMTYNTAHPNKVYTFDVSLSPLSYNLMICTSNLIPHENYGIDPDKHSKSTFGSSAEFKLTWIITNNIQLASRLFFFTDYDRSYSDWENTIVFDINKYLTTQLYLNIRYDSDTPAIEDSNWKKVQVKEILSIGFSYKFSSI